MWGLAKRDGVETWCVFLFSAVLLVIFYWTSPGDKLTLLRNGVVTQQYNWQSESESLMSISTPRRPLREHRPEVKPELKSEEAQQQNQRRVAICLVGGLRAFELTGPSIRKYLLDVYPEADLFIHAPIDGDAQKLTLLTGRPRLASARLFSPGLLNETYLPKQLLTAHGSPHGIQGLLQYFRLVEGCWSMIQDYEAHNNFTYDWVIRSRVDSYWNGPMLPIEAFNASKYYVPYGSSFGGLNDRLGVGTRETSRVALQRMSLLPEIHQHGYGHLNSERSFQAQFTTSHVEVVELDRFPFCVMSKRRYGGNGIPVASILSRRPLNGAKCRPCTPNLVGGWAWKARNKTDESRGSLGPTDEAQLCDARHGWEHNWEQVYDTAAGPDMAEVRKRMASRSRDECIRDMQLFQQQWEFWNATSPEDLCRGLKLENDESALH